MAAVVTSELPAGNGDIAGDVGPRTITMSGGGPYGFRLTDGESGQLVVSKLRKRGRADEAGLREGDALLTINGRSCHGFTCCQAMDLIDSAGQTLAIRVNRGPPCVNASSSPLSSSSTTTTTTTTVHRLTSSTVTRTPSSAQERAGQSVYVPTADPVSVTVQPQFVPTTATSPPSASITHRSPGRTRGTGADTDSGITVSAPPGVDVQHDSVGRTFTLTFGGLGAAVPPAAVEPVAPTAGRQGQQQGPAVGVTPLVWQPSSTRQSDVVKTTSSSSSVEGVLQRQATGNRPPHLARILQESKDQEGPDSPSSPSGRSKKMFIDSAFYDDPEHKYPTVQEQISLARLVAQSVLAPANLNSRGHKMFVKRRERSVRWEAGYNPAEHDQDAEAAAAAAGENDTLSPSLTTTTPHTLTSFVFAPKLPSGETIIDPEKLDAMSSEELERVMMFEKKSTHTTVTPQVCFNLADDLRNMKGKGGRLFAKRQAKSESWAVGADGSDGTEELPDDPSLLTSTAELRLSGQSGSEQSSSTESAPARCEAMPVNRLKEMVELPRAAMTPWDAMAKFGTVDPAFQHLEAASTSSSAAAASASRRDTSKQAGNTGGRIKSWTGNPEAAAALASAMTASMQSKDKSSYQSVKFTVPPPTTGTGTVDS